MMLAFNPLLLIYDVGFQLSFLAVMGLIYIEPLIRILLKFILKRFLGIKIEEKYDNYLMMFSSTLAAQIFTLAVMVFNFGNISFVAPITNILVSVIVQPLMILGFLSAFAGIFWNALGWLLSVPCYFLLSYFLRVIDFFAKPWAMLEIQEVNFAWLVIFYILLSFATRYLNRRFTRFIA